MRINSGHYSPHFGPLMSADGGCLRRDRTASAHPTIVYGMTTTEVRADIRTRTRTVNVAVALQFLFALAYLIVPVAGLIFGADVQAAAEAELAGQGLSPTILADKGIRFDESGTALVIPVATAAIAVLLACLNLAGKRAGRILTFIFQPLFVIMDVLILFSQSSQVQYLQSLLGGGADAQAVIDAAYGAYPAWLLTITDGRGAFTVAASLVVIVLMLLPSGRK
ncbi:hypothetical protein HII36_23915 [Nonomuraea sp. NN258]|uniref:hypothetical protein n=1 Tax=Nonomuraea antri TaxID=2730852 RepID=UPI0015681FE7|nr:hypothetical protein [Nonomuraea antri]NRQ34855.1 hypothetical protein [Nonomuraea antri]